MKIESFVVGAFEENAYLVVDDETRHAVLIDPGDDPARLISAVRASRATLDAIWLTHGHLDHIGAVAGIRRAYDVPVFLHPEDLPLYRRSAESAEEYGVPFEQPDDPDRTLAEGDVMRLGPLEFEVIHTPGHAPGHVAFRLGTTLFGGDLLFAGSIGRTDLLLSNPVHMEQSLARICELDDATVVYPGHGPVTRLGHERATNGFLAGTVRLSKR